MAEATPIAPIRVIGIGNDDCGDDAVGVVLLDRLQAADRSGVVYETFLGDGLNLILEWPAAPLVLLLDAVRSGAEPGVIHHIDLKTSPLPHCGGVVSSHGFGVAQLVELARAMNVMPGRFVLVGVEGCDFAPGAQMSPAVTSAVDQALAIAIREIERACALRGRGNVGFAA